MEVPDFLNTRLPLLSLRVRGAWKKHKIFQVIHGKQCIRAYSEYDGSAKGHLIKFQSKFAAAVWRWQQMPYNERRWFISRAAKLGLRFSGYNYFISLYMNDKLEGEVGYPDPHHSSHEIGGADEIDTKKLASEFLDDIFKILDDIDPTKKIQFQASEISPGTTRTITMPDKDITLGDVPDQSVIEMNILLLAFKLAIENSLTKFNLVDGLMDEFEDESGVDAGASVNEGYDPTNKYYSPLATAVAWEDELNADSILVNYTIRQILTSASISNSGTKIRVRIQANSGVNLNIDHISIVERDPGTPNGITTPTEILFGGTSGTFILAGEDGESDLLDYALDKTKGYLLIADIADTGGGLRKQLAGGNGLYVKPDTNSYNAQNLAGSELIEDATYGFNRLEVESVADSMILVSIATEAVADPDTMRIVIMEEDVDVAALNTDITAYASRDNGVNWVQATLEDEGDYGNGKRIIEGEADVSGQASDKTLKWKITTHNGKNLKLHGLGLLWR